MFLARLCFVGMIIPFLADENKNSPAAVGEVSLMAKYAQKIQNRAKYA